MKTLRVKIEEKICFLGLNRPDKSNSLNKEMLLDLQTFFDTTREDTNFKIVVLYGEGGIFCSGGCLDWMKQGVQQTDKENLADANIFVNIFVTMRSYPKPIIASVERLAMGGALGLIACADLAIAEEDVVFAFKEVRVGLIPATIAPHIMQRIGAANSRKYMLTGNDFTAQEAHQSGLLQFLAEPKRLKEKTREVCRQILLASPTAVSETKQLIKSLEDNVLSPEEQNFVCAKYIAESRGSMDGIEGVSAFFEKRKPIWNEPNYSK